MRIFVAGASGAIGQPLDAAAVEQALRDARAEVVIDELTSLPKDPSGMAASAPGDRNLQIEGGANLHRAATACGVHRYIQQVSGVWSWIQIEDAVVATAEVLMAPPGVYHVVDDDPSPVAVWLPAFARFVGAPPPPRITEEQARSSAGDDIVYYGTKLRGASNEKAKKTFGFKPRRLEWLSR